MVSVSAVKSACGVAARFAALNRHSLPSLIMVGQEVGDLVANHPTGADFRRHLAELKPAV